MRVCFVTTAFPRWVGDGQAAFVWEAIRAVARQGVHVEVIAMHSPGVPTNEYMEGVRITRPRYWWPERWELLRKEGAAGLPATWRKYPLVRLQLFPLLFVHTLTTARHARRCDLIHAEWSFSAAAAVLSRWLHRSPILATLQGSDIFQATRHPVGSHLTRHVLQHCDRITALSRALQQATAAVGVPVERIKIVPNGVDTNRFLPPRDGEREKLILYVGSFIERKGLRYLLDAMPEILRGFPDFRLVLIGEGPQEIALRQQAEELGIAERTVFIGFQPQDEIKRWMQKAKALVLPSLEEGMGVVLLEALACGTPLVASQIDGIQDVVTPDVGVLVPPADPQALAEGLRKILTKPGSWDEMSLAARERAVSHYDWDHVASQFVELYRTMLARSD